MKSNLFALRITAAVFSFFSFVIFAVSCGQKPPDEETVRLYARAGSAYAQGKFQETAVILQETKKFPPALVLRAKAQYFSGDFEEAEKSCRRALKLRPSSFEAKLYLARILREKGDLRGAAEAVEALLADNPQDISALYFASQLASETGRNDEVAIFLDRAAELSSESALVLLDRARLRWVSGAGDAAGVKALEDLSRAKAMLPWNTPLEKSITNLEKRIKETL